MGRAATHAAAEVLDQDEHSADWRTQRKHFFVLSNAGAFLRKAEYRCLHCTFVTIGHVRQCCIETACSAIGSP